MGDRDDGPVPLPHAEPTARAEARAVRTGRAAALSTLLTAAVLDRAAAFIDLTYTRRAAARNEEQRIERAEFGRRAAECAGFRERRLPSPAAGVLRVVTLGDSFTQGYGVEEDEAWPSAPEAASTRDGGTHEVVNPYVLTNRRTDFHPSPGCVPARRSS
jgi:hypothetical protein